jgi:hypothetical protein
MSDGVEAWATFRGTIHPSRNAVVHRGDLADRATAEIAMECATVLLGGLVGPIANRLHLDRTIYQHRDSGKVHPACPFRPCRRAVSFSARERSYAEDAKCPADARVVLSWLRADPVAPRFGRTGSSVSTASPGSKTARLRAATMPILRPSWHLGVTSRRMRSSHSARHGGLWLAGMLVLGACSANPSPSPSASANAAPSPSSSAAGLARFTHDEWSVEYPAAWRFFPIAHFSFSFYSLAGYLASTPVDTSQICQTTPGSTSCNARGYALPPDNVVIAVGNGGVPMDHPIAFYDHPSHGTPARVGGMAAVFEEVQQAADHVVLTWKIARPTAFGNWVQLDADLRGPGEAVLRTQVEALVASFRFTPAPTPMSSDSAVAQAIARKALANLKTDSAYACYPDEAGASRAATITGIPYGPPLSSPLPVTCSAMIASTDVGFWKLDLTIAWEAAGGRQAGTNHVVQWLQPDGSLGASSGSGDWPGS